MTKFKVGDKVRVVRNGTGSEKADSWIGYEFAVFGHTNNHLTAPMYWGQDDDNRGPFYESELKLVNEEKTLDQQLEDAKNLVAGLEQKIQDAKPKAADFDLGAVVVLEGDYGPDGGSTHTKAGKDYWVWSHKRNASEDAAAYTDVQIDQFGIKEVLSEGI